MCIPIDLDVPVLSADGIELGTAREILCASTHDDESDGEPTPIRRAPPADDLWLRASRPIGPDLYIPFAEIAETRADGVRLRATADAAEARGWETAPPDLSAGRAVAV